MRPQTKIDAAPAKAPSCRKAQTKPGARPGRPTKDQIEARNRELLDATLELFLEKGFEAVTIREITESVGMAKRTVVARYGNKISLFKAALKRAIDGWAVPEERLIAAETDDLEETMLAIARILVANYLSPVGFKLARITNAEAYRMPEISLYSTEQCTRPLVNYLSDLFRRKASADQNFPDAEHYAWLFLHLVGAPARMVRWGVQMTAEDIEKQMEYAVRLFLHGLPRR